jgi:hypothetical protein
MRDENGARSETAPQVFMYFPPARRPHNGDDTAAIMTLSVLVKNRHHLHAAIIKFSRVS